MGLLSAFKWEWTKKPPTEVDNAFKANKAESKAMDDTNDAIAKMQEEIDKVIRGGGSGAPMPAVKDPKAPDGIETEVSTIILSSNNFNEEI